jgi:hypothetical protein
MNEKRKNKLEQLSNPPPRRKRRFSLRQKMFGLFNEFMAYSQLHLMNAEMIQYTLRSKRFQKLMDEKYPAFQKLKEDIPSQ